MGSDEKLQLQTEYSLNGLWGVLDLTHVKGLVVLAAGALIHAYKTIYVIKLLILVVTMWWVRFVIGTTQAVVRREWTGSQCKAGLFEFAGLSSFTSVIYFGVGQVHGLEWVTASWVAAWLTAETAMLASKFLPYMPAAHPLTKVMAAMIRFFHTRIDNMTDLMSRLGKKKKDGETDEQLPAEGQGPRQIGGGESGSERRTEDR